MVEIIFTRPDDDVDWVVHIKAERVPMPGNLVAFQLPPVPGLDMPKDMNDGDTYRVDETVWSVMPGHGITQVEVMLVNV